MVKTTEYARKDGSKGVKYELEDGDEFVPEFSKPRKNDKGQFDNYSLQAKVKGVKDLIYLSLTKGQATSKVFEGDVKGKTLVAYSYKHPKFVGNFIGVKEKK